MTEVRKISISKSIRDRAIDGTLLKDKNVCVEGDNSEECKKIFEELWKNE